MIAPGEQQEILRHVNRLVAARLMARRKVEKSEWTPRMASAKVKTAEQALVEYLGQAPAPHIAQPDAAEWQSAYMNERWKNSLLTEQLRTKK